MKRLLLAIVALLSVACAQAQLLSWTPPFPTENDNSQTLVITMDASLGNHDLLNYTPNTDVYVHLGVITNLSTGPTNWQHAGLFTWATTPAAANAAYLGNNKWKFTITGSLRTYFGLTDANEHIQKIAILFRNGAGTKVQRNADASDMYVPVYSGTDIKVRLDQPFRQPTYNMTPEPQTWATGTAFTVQASASAASSMKLYHNGTQIASGTGVSTLTGNSTVAGFGQQTIVAEANNGSTTTYDTIKIFVGPTASPVAALPAGVVDGVNYTSNTAATLVLRAPGKNKVTVIGDFNNWLEDLNYVMNKTPDGKFFWLNLTGLTPGTQYGFQYKVDDSIRIADPYATLVLDPYNDQYISATTYPNMKPYPTGLTTGVVGVLQTAAPAYNWATAASYVRPDKRTLITYELLMRDFIANHDWKTLTDTLSYLKNLGVNALEIMPFNEFEGNLSWGYNPDFYFSADKYYGPAADLKRFVDSCHGRGIAVIMDIALNHSFGMSPMVQLYWDRANNRPSASNPWYNPVAKHAFNVGYDFNHESLDTRYFTTRVMDYWTKEFKIDGFRFDLSKGFTQKQTCDNNGNNCDVGSWSAYDQSRVDIWKRYYDSLQLKAPGSYAVLEHLADNSEEKVLANYGLMFWGNMSGPYEQSAMGFATTNASLDGALFTSRGWNNPYLMAYAESHDEERLMYKMLNFGNSSGSYNVRDLNTALDRMKLVGAFLFTIPGPKMIWQFGELGYDYSINYCTNGTISDGCRTGDKPIRWDYAAVAARKSVYDTWAKIIKLRSHPWFKNNFVSDRIGSQLNGNFRWLQITTDTSNICVVGNFDVAATSGTVTFQNAGTWYDLLTNATFTATGSQQNINLAPGEYHIYVNRNINNSGTSPVSNLVTNGNRLDAGVYPNPARQEFVVDLYLPQAAATSFDLVNGAGQVVRSLRQSFLPGGRQLITLQRGGIAAGTYYLRVVAKSGTRILPLILQ